MNLPQPANPGVPVVEPTRLDPAAVVDTLLRAALASGADTISVHPHHANRGQYVTQLELRGRAIGHGLVPRTTAIAALARLAALVDVDGFAESPVGGRTRAVIDGREVQLVVAIRPGAAPRCEVFVTIVDDVAPTRLPSETLAPGARVGHYRILGRRGGGGMGMVYEVEHVALSRRFALKTIRPELLSSDPTVTSGFLSEARAAARVRHPNIVDIVDYGELPDGRPYIVMELLDGESLRSWDSSTSVRQTLTVAREIAAGLAALHAAGIVHADVSLGNVLLCNDGHARLVDFGLAQFLDDPGRLSRESDIVTGTPAYIAPEVITGRAPTPASDQYSFGAVLFELLTDRAPYHGDSVRAVALRHLTAPIPSAMEARPGLGIAVDLLIRRCLAKAAHNRFPTTEALVAALDDLLSRPDAELERDLQTEP